MQESEDFRIGRGEKERYAWEPGGAQSQPGAARAGADVAQVTPEPERGCPLVSAQGTTG